MRRGFPTQAEHLATAVRAELGLDPHDRLDPRALASDYGTPVVSIAELIAEGASADSIRQLTVVDDGCFSAGTVFVGTSRLIIYNPAHSDGRLANSLAHELAHLLLEHEPGPAIGDGGCRVWNQEMEEEADRLAALLLVPRDAALACARVGLPHPVGAARFGVSTDLMRWRTDHSGAAKQAQAAAKQRGRAVCQLSASDQRQLVSDCDLGWLADLTAKDWLTLVATCGRCISAGSVSNLIDFLSEDSPTI